MGSLPEQSQLAEYRARALEIIQDAFAHGGLTTEDLERRTELIENARSMDEIEMSVRDLAVRSMPSEPAQPALSCILGERKINRPLTSFQDTHVKTILGETTIDMRKTDHRGLGARSGSLDLLVVMGSVTITVPRDTALDLEITPVMASIEERGKQKRTTAPPRLRLTGKVIMGEVTIRRRS